MKQTKRIKKMLESTPNRVSLDVKKAVEFCKSNATAKFDETIEMLEASFLGEFDNIEQLNNSKKELQKLNDAVKITFLDTKSIMSY